MEANCGPALGALTSGVGRQTPMADGDPTMPRAPTKGGGGGLNPSVLRQFQMLSATCYPQVILAAMDCGFSAVIAAIEASWCMVSELDCAG
jgi:hypothetical protein